MSTALRSAISVLAAGSLVAGVSYYTGDHDDASSPAAAGETAERPVNNPLGYMEWMYAQRADPDGTIPYDAVAAAVAQSRQMTDDALARSSGQAAKRWKLTGPSNIGGRITELAADPSQEGVVYAAAATGGIWKSTNAGRTFESVWDNSSVQSMGAVAVDEDGVVWVGTGEPDNGGGSAYYGDGVYKSTDGGESWDKVGLERSGSVGRIAIDPRDPDTVFVAAQGRLHDTDGQRGLFRTDDGGETWDLVLEPKDDQLESVGVIDVAIHPDQSNVVLATAWDKIRAQDGRIYGKFSRLYRSADGGDTWTNEQEDPLPVSYDDPDEPVNDTYVGRMGIAFAPDDADTVYLISSTAGGNFNGFFRSTNTGRDWEAVGPTSGGTLQNISGGFAWWFGRVWVDPQDTDHVFVAGVQLAESRNGGESWAVSGSIHVDQHGMAFDPFDPDTVYLGNDGGFYRSESEGAVGQPWFKTSKFPITQFYAMDASEQDVDRLNAGSQDNNSLKSWQGSGEVTGDWVPYVGGDGMMNRIDPEDQRYYYGCSQNGGCQAFTPNGSRSITIPGARKNWVAPLEFKNTNTKTLFGGSERFLRINIESGTWEALSDDLTGGPTPRGPGFGTLTAIGSGYDDKDLAWAGTDDGRLWRSTNVSAPAGDVKWKRIKHKNVPKRWVTRVEVSPRNDKWTAASFSGWRWLDTESQALVSLTKNRGKSWKDISGNLPKAPVNDVIWHPKNKNWLYAATDVGVFATRNLGKDWEKVGANLPLTPVHDITIQEKGSTLYAATFGRSIWHTSIKER